MSKFPLAAMALVLASAAIGAPATAQSDGATLNADHTVAQQLFDKGDGYFWVLIRSPKNDGYRCAVSFITTDGNYSIHGPIGPEMVKTGTGMLWFDSPKVPKATAPMQRVTLAVHGNDGALSWPALLETVGKTPHGTLMVAVQIASVLKEKADTNDLSVSLDGKEVFAAKLVGLQKAYARLAACMAARTGS